MFTFTFKLFLFLDYNQPYPPSRACWTHNLLFCVCLRLTLLFVLKASEHIPPLPAPALAYIILLHPLLFLRCILNSRSLAGTTRIFSWLYWPRHRLDTKSLQCSTVEYSC
jgi:hypothetical protein